MISIPIYELINPVYIFDFLIWVVLFYQCIINNKGMKYALIRCIVFAILLYPLLNLILVCLNIDSMSGLMIVAVPFSMLSAYLAMLWPKLRRQTPITRRKDDKAEI